jgi:3-hydroxyisobutyrate dehydrogenase
MSGRDAVRTVGVIGLGSMGLGVARSLLRAGFTVLACEPRAAVLEGFVAEGGQAAADPADLAGKTDIIILLVVNAEQAEAVLFGARGAAAALPKGAVVMVSATVAPDYAEGLGRRLTALGLLMIDAPVSGGAAKANTGQLSIMAAGPDAAFDKAAPVLAAIAEKVHRLGVEPGQGSRVKLINQLLAGVHIAAAAEAMALGIKIGCDPQSLYDVISNSAGASWMFQNRVPHILAGDYTPLSAVNIFVKDLGIVLESGKRNVFPLPLTAAAHQLFMMAAAQGHGAEDDSAVIKVFPGIDLPGD